MIFIWIAFSITTSQTKHVKANQSPESTTIDPASLTVDPIALLTIKENDVHIEIDTDKRTSNQAQERATTQKSSSSRPTEPASVTRSAVSSGSYDEILVKYFPASVIPQAKKVIACESGGRATVVSRTGDYGLFQINKVAHERTLQKHGKSINDMLDPEQNIWYASLLYKGGGWGAWYMSRPCHHLV